ncbi:MAG: hydroxyphenylacetyl-CoA thioesterase PaaI [Actinomycetota bacterium]|nr:hydroxyphenylacetyl-CoA thioesterase PaaI [Actinomycetota bacterium]
MTAADDDAAGQAVRTMVKADTASNLLGIEVMLLEAGHAIMRMTVTASMLNGHGICHGGYLFLLADTAFGAACNSVAGGGAAVASSCDVTFVAPAQAGDVLQAEALERLSFGRSGLFDVTVRRADGTVVVEFRGHSRRLPDSSG